MQVATSLKKSFKVYSGLPKSIYVLFVANIVNNMGNFVWPFLTILFTRKLGLGAEKAGLIVTIAILFQLPGAFVAGKVADKVGRKKVLVFYQSAAGFLFIPAAFMLDPYAIATIVVISGFFWGGVQPVSRALITDLTQGEQRIRAFSLTYLGVNIGFALGPLLAGFLYAYGIKVIFLGNAFSCLASSMLSAFFVKEPATPSEGKNSFEAPVEGGLIDVLKLRPSLFFFSLIWFIYSFVYVQSTFGMSLTVTDLFGELTGAKVLGSLMTANGLGVVLLTGPLTKIFEHREPLTAIYISGILYAVGFGMLAFVKSYLFLLISAFIWTAGEVAGAVTVNVYISDRTPVTHRGRVNAFLHIMSRAGFSAGPVVMGAVASLYGLKLLWLLSGVLALAGAIAVLYLRQLEGAL
ncbi:MFS transporter [Carboxydothermus hydrogenoformans]|uniref:Putative transporter n=1 Tax=Carboxydothermus hydrogenoformans (strain ATCC BAA-161 / DSM 6008 / Z-2901) TaxID=246194 RepID=Q3AFW4_CARHZ|nr:MFS transporter [Carboxydothermus hydrogenoformans]ABB13656.1 putative transporter [Carboxydothermus hydrogenoformans Z-2901]